MKLVSIKRNLLATLGEASSRANKCVCGGGGGGGRANQYKELRPILVSKMNTGNYGHVNIIEKAKEYKEKKNIEIPPYFEGNSFVVLSPHVLGNMVILLMLLALMILKILPLFMI